MQSAKCKVKGLRRILKLRKEQQFVLIIHFAQFNFTFNLFVLYRKSMKGGLCDRNACHNRCVFVVYSIFVNARVFLYWRTKNMEVKLYETIN